MTDELKNILSDELSSWLGITSRTIQKMVKNSDPLFPPDCYGYEKGVRSRKKLVFPINNLYRQVLKTLESNNLHFDRSTGALIDKTSNAINPESLDTRLYRNYLIARHINKDFPGYITDTGRRSWQGKGQTKDQIDRILELRQGEGLTITQIAERLGRHKSTISRTLRQYEEKGYGFKVQNKLHKRGRKKKQVAKEVYDYLVKQRTITDNVSDIIYHTKRQFKGTHDLGNHIIRRTVAEIEATAGDPRNLQGHNFKRAKNLNRTYLPKSYRDMQPNDEWFMDFHYINAAKVLDQSTGEIGNIRTMAILDGRTRRLIGYKHTLGTPNATEVAYMVIDTAYKHGWPKSIFSDAGSENLQSMKGLESFLRGLNDCGLKMSKSGFQAKSSKNGLVKAGGHYTRESEMPRQNIIERFFLTMKGRFEKRLKGFDMSGKGRYPKDTPMITREDYEGQFEEFVHSYENEWKHSSIGCTPQKEYETALQSGFQPVMPLEQDRITYLMHFMPRQKVSRSKGFGSLMVRVKSPYSGEYLHFDIQDIDPREGTVYVAVAPDEKQAAIYDENDNFLFVAPCATAREGSDDKATIDLYTSRLAKQHSNQKPIRKVIKEAEQTDTLYPKPVPVSQAAKLDKKVSKMIPDNFKASDEPKPSERPRTDKKQLKKIFSQFEA